MTQNFKFGNLTDVGLVRKANEDYYGCFDTPNGYVFVICDGMGGHVGGAVASQTAVAAIKQYFESSHANLFVAMQASLEQANDAIIQKIKEAPELDGMGTTCVLLIIKDGKVYYAHIGDSRIYYIHRDEMKPITKDHSFVQSLVDEGHITEEEAEKHPNKNQITKALGIHPSIEPTICNEPIVPVPGDYFLLCSDGLTGMTNEKAIRETIINSEKNLQEKVSQLIELAKEGGGKDNITAQLVQFVDTPVDIPKRESAASANLDGTTTDFSQGNENIIATNKRKVWPLLSLLLLVGLGLGAYFVFNPSSGQHTNEMAMSDSKTAMEETTPAPETQTNIDTTSSKPPKEEMVKQENINSIKEKKKITDSSKAPKAANNKLSIEDIPLPSPGATMKPGGSITGAKKEYFEYEIKKTDSIVHLEKLFRKSWSKIKSEDGSYGSDKPEPGTTIKIKTKDYFYFKNSTEKKEKINEILSKYKISEGDLIFLNDRNVVLIPD